MEADKRWATGPDCRLGDKSGKNCFCQHCHAPPATLECFGFFRLIVSHKLSSAVLTQDGQDWGFHRHSYTVHECKRRLV